MAETTRRRHADGWRLQHAAHCDAWSEGSAVCPHCGTRVSLADAHVGAQVVRAAGDGPIWQKRGVESERLAFCDRDCLDEWVGDDW